MTEEEYKEYVKDGGSGSYEVDLESVDTAKKLAYGAEQERFILPLLATHAEAAYDHVFTEDMTYGESLRSQEDERQLEILKKFPEMQGVRVEDEDGAIFAGRIGSAFVDPVSWLIPWTKLGKAATLTGTAVKSGLWGGAITGAESAARETAMYGVEGASGTVIAASTAIGAIAPAALGAVSYKLFPKQFQDEIADAQTNPDKLKAAVIEEDIAPNLKPDEIADVERVTESVVSPSTVAEASKGFANINKELEVTNILANAIKLHKEVYIKNFPKDSPYRKKFNQKIKNLEARKKTLESKTIRSTLEEYLPEKAKSTIEILEKLKSEGKLTNKIMTTVLHEATRPIVGGIGGLAYGGILGDEYDDTILFSSITAGATLGFLSRRLETSKLLTDVDMKTGNLILQDSAFSNFRSNMKILTAGTTSTRLEAFGGWNKVIGSMLFSKFGSATDSVEAITLRNQSNFLGKHAEILGDSFDDESVNRVVGEVMRGYTKLEDLKIGYSGLTKEYAPLIQEQIDEIKRITPELTKLVDDTANRMAEVGIKFNKIDNYGLPQLWDLNLIEKDSAKFIEDLTEAIKIQKANGGKGLVAKTFLNRLTGVQSVSKTPYKHSRNVFEYNNKTDKITFRKSADFFENNRELIDLEATKYMAERGWIDINAGRAVGNYGLNSIKVADFAETFGPNGEVINEALAQIKKSFDKRPELRDRQERYRDALTDSIEGYWGVYGASTGNKGANNFMRLATSLANMSYLTTVTIANMGDLLQPFINSGFGTAAKTLATRTVSPSSRKFSKLSHFKYDQSWEREYSAMITKNVNPFNRKKDFIEWSNQLFFRAIGLQSITGVARNFAYDVGVNNAFKMAKKATPNSEKALLRMEQLGLSIEELNLIKKYDNIVDAFESEEVGQILDKAGRKSADRDAIIPTVGNRLLFTQTANPYIRPLGQFLSWAQAKSAQTNALIKRVEDGDMKLALTSLATVPLYMGVQTLKEWANPEFRAGEKPLTIEDDWVEGLGKGLALSGNYSNWAIDKFIGAVRSMNYGEGALESASPAVSFLVDVGYNLPKDAWKDLAAGDTEGAIREVGERVPVVSIAANIAERVLDAPIIIDREERNTGGVLGEEVPNTTQEPEERVDKMTGVPYDVQAGGSNVDIQERSSSLLGILQKRQREKFSIGSTVGSILVRKGLPAIKEGVEEVTETVSDFIETVVPRKYIDLSETVKPVEKAKNNHDLYGVTEAEIKDWRATKQARKEPEDIEQKKIVRSLADESIPIEQRRVRIQNYLEGKDVEGNIVSSPVVREWDAQSVEDLVKNLPSNKDIVISTAAKVESKNKFIIGVNDNLETGDLIAFRLDIPAYRSYDIWTLTAHKPK